MQKKKSGRNAFIRTYILSDIVLILLVIMTMTPIIFRSIRLSNEKIAGEVKAAVLKTAAELENMFQGLQSMMMYPNKEILDVTRISGKPVGSDYYKMSKASQFISIIGKSNASIKEIIVLFQQNDVIIRTGGCFDTNVSFDHYYRDATIREDISGGRNTHRFLSNRRLFIGSQSNVVEVFGYCFPNNAIIGSNACVFISTQATLTDKLLPVIGNDGFYLLTDAIGNRIAQLGDTDRALSSDNGQFMTSSASCLNGALTLLAGCPREMVTDSMLDLYTLLGAVLIWSLIVGLSISAINVHRINIPFQRLNRELSLALEHADVSKEESLSLQNELEDIRRQEHDFEEQVQEFRNTLRNSAITILFTCGYLRDEDKSFILAQTGDIYNGFIVGYGEVNTMYSVEYQDEMLTLLLGSQRKHLPLNAIFCQIGHDTVATLFAAEDLEYFRSYMVSRGVTWSFSTPMTGIDNVSYALEQARFFRDDGGQITGPEFQKLQQFVAAGDTSQAELLLEDLLSRTSRSSLLLDGVRAILALLGRQCGHTSMPPILSGNKISSAECSALHQYVRELCDIVNTHKKSHNTKLKEMVLTYIREHFNQSDCYAGVIAEHVGISEKYLYSFVKEQTGYSVGEYISNLRMEKACELLIGSDIPINRIYCETGFNSENTFYKAFRRKFGISPGAYRQQQQHIVDS